MDKIHVSPKLYEPPDTTQSPPDDHDSDDDDDDGGERALLGESTQTRRKEKPRSFYMGFWKQTSGIVVEVSVSSFRSIVSNSGPGTSRHYRLSSSRRWAVCLRGSSFLKYPYVKLFIIFCLLLILYCGSTGKQ